MKKTIIFILVALFATGSLYADDISVQQALQIASQFAAKDPTAQSKMTMCMSSIMAMTWVSWLCQVRRVLMQSLVIATMAHLIIRIARHR